VGSRQITLSVARHLRGRDFSERDRLVLALLRPHIAKARSNAAAFKRTFAAPAGIVALTAREAQVARWLSRGKANPEIAAILEMRPRTVEKHVEHILEKLGVENRTSASLMLQVQSDDPEK
jgi:DNA-binding CsgD family transcriptional regulator